MKIQRMTDLEAEMRKVARGEIAAPRRCSFAERGIRRGAHPAVDTGQSQLAAHDPRRQAAIRCRIGAAHQSRRSRTCCGLWASSRRSGLWKCAWSAAGACRRRKSGCCISTSTPTPWRQDRSQPRAVTALASHRPRGGSLLSGAEFSFFGAPALSPCIRRRGGCFVHRASRPAARRNRPRVRLGGARRAISRALGRTRPRGRARGSLCSRSAGLGD